MGALIDKRVLFFGGKGGVGKTTSASAMAVAASKSGKRVLLVSTDPAHSTSDIFERPIGPEPVPLLPNLPTVEEQGVPGYDFSSWIGTLAPAGVPAPAQKVIADPFAAILGSAQREVAEPLFRYLDQTGESGDSPILGTSRRSSARSLTIDA